MDLKATIKDVIASIVGSAACVYTGQPFDTIKVLLACLFAYLLTYLLINLLIWLRIHLFTNVLAHSHSFTLFIQLFIK